MNEKLSTFWDVTTDKLFEDLQTRETGLINEEVKDRLFKFKHSLLKSSKKATNLVLLLKQFASPIILLILFAAILSFFLREHTDAIIMLSIVVISCVLQFWQEKKAEDAISKLLSIVQVKVCVLRNNNESEIPIHEVVPGDVVVLKAGDIIPGDCRILESRDLFVDEATLTGETYPRDKSAGICSHDASLSKRTNCIFMGTHVVSGYGKALVVHIGNDTEFGKLSKQIELRPPETEFESGVRQFGNLLIQVTLILVIAIFAINVFFHRPVLESLLFSLALAIGMTPQLLPAIITINLSQGALYMAHKKVIVKRLVSIEDFGSMNIFCSDKTGTLTEANMKLQSGLDFSGKENKKVLEYAYLNAFHETSFKNPIDETIRTGFTFDISNCQKLDEIPYDFIRKRLSVLVSKDDHPLMVTKGALLNVLSVCTKAEAHNSTILDIENVKDQIKEQYEKLSNEGFRILGISYKETDLDKQIKQSSEADMIFLGLLVFFAPPKAGVIEVINQLKQIGVSLKIVTGDNKLIAINVGKHIGLSISKIITGSELNKISDEALLNQVNDVDIFAEVEPNQKERIITAFKKSGNVVGYMGDGINDATALHVADVGISVDSGVDVAKEAADIVLLEKDLAVLLDAIKEGRITFANTLKYVFMTSSANFGNMFSVACASLFLPFLPLLPKQILLTNLLTDLPQMAIATDTVDKEIIERPRRWDTKFIRNFMITFGTLSSIFDFLTFGILLLILNSSPALFRTGWFMESVISESLIFFAIRTQRPFFKSIPGKFLLIVTLISTLIALIIPLTSLGKLFEFTQVPFWFLPVIFIIVFLYLVSNEITKKFFYNIIKW